MAGLDRIDLRILNALSADGRLSWRDLAQKIGLSLTPTLRRVKRLEEERYIQGYHAQLVGTRLAGSVSVFVSGRLGKQSTGAETLTCIPGVASVTSAFSLKAVLLRPAPPL